MKTSRFHRQGVVTPHLKMLIRVLATGCEYGVAAFLSVWASSISAQTLLTALEHEMRNIVQVAKPSVVTIMATTVAQKTEDASGLFGILGGRHSDAHQVKIGSGLIVSSDGFIVTKESVVRDAARVEVALANEQSFPAEIAALDSLSDIAVLKLNAEKLTPVRIGATDAVQPGSWVAVIGNALGMPHAVSFGMVSAIHSNGVIQISANVDPGSIGSPVFNAQGKAIGIISGRMSIEQADPATGNYFSGTALVCPLAPRLASLREIARQYYQTRGWLGVTVVADSHHQGLPKVLHLMKDGPAERAGILVGDVITHFASQPIASFTQLREMVAACRPGTSVNLAVVRQDGVLNFIVEIGQQTPIALAELQSAPEDDLKDDKPNGGKPPKPIQINLETQQQIRQRIQALEKELRLLRSLQQKP